MDFVSLAIAAIVFLDGLFSLITGRSLGRTKTPNHEPVAFKKWTRICGLLLVIISVVYLFWEIPALRENVLKDSATLVLFGTFGLVIAVMIISFFVIVKSADRKAGISGKGRKGNQTKYIDED